MVSASPSFKHSLHHTFQDPSAPKRLRLSAGVSISSSSSLRSQVLRSRQIEQDLLRSLFRFSVVLRFEAFPIWILALDPQFITHIFVPEFSSWSSFQCAFSHSFRNKLLLEVLLQLAPSKFYFGELPSTACSYLYLYSGSLSYLHSLYVSSSNIPTIFLVHPRLHSRSLPSSPLSLSRITRKSVCGVTNFKTIWSVQNLSNFSPNLTGLRRRLGSIIDHSNRKATSIFLPYSEPHLTLNQFLPVTHLNANILVPSTFAASGFGVRKLTSSELLIAFGFPSTFGHLSVEPSDLIPIVPLQILDSLLRPAALSLSTPSVSTSVPQFTLAPPSLPNSGTYLPSLGRVLPNAWCLEKEHVQQAAKEDDAPVNYSLWNLRITSVLPHISIELCDWLRARLLRRQKAQLYREFRRYLRSTHGALYDCFLQFGKYWLIRQTSEPYPARQGGVLPFRFHCPRFRIFFLTSKLESMFYDPFAPPPSLIGHRDPHSFFGDVIHLSAPSLEMAFHLATTYPCRLIRNLPKGPNRMFILRFSRRLPSSYSRVIYALPLYIK